MYKFLCTVNITRICKTLPLKTSKRTKMKTVLEDDCKEIFQRPCEDKPYRPKTGLLVLHPGEATNQKQIKSFLYRVAQDKTFTLAMPSIKSPGGWRTVAEVEEQYEQIGGYSPHLKWAGKLIYGIEKRLDKDLPVFSPFKALIGYRYASPLVTTAIKEFEVDNIKHMVVISLEPHYFCQKTGPCYDGVYKFYKKHKLPKWSWTVVDRWPLQHMLCDVFAQGIQLDLDTMPPERRQHAIIFFVGNGLLHDDIRKGEIYHFEVGVTVHNTMRILNNCNDYTLCWLAPENCSQSLKPTLDDALCRAYNDGHRNFILVPITYTCECLDTLYEIDIAIVQKYRKKWGCDAMILRTSAPNDHVFMINAIAKVIRTALKSETRVSEQFLTQCHGCRMNTCKNNKRFYKKLLK